MQSRPSPPPLRASPSASPHGAEATSSSPPAAPSPPRQSFVFGPRTTAAVGSATHAVYVQDDVDAPPTTAAALSDFRAARRRADGAATVSPSRHPGVPARHSASPPRSTAAGASTGPAAKPSGGGPVAAPASTSAATPTADELRELQLTRSLFLCGRGLLSLRHIQHLREMTALRSLSVHMNSIKELERGCLRTLRHLVDLDLSANELRDIPAGCWEGLTELERLNLSSNQLTKLGPTAFAALTSLQWLSLGFNSISDVGGLRSVPASAPLAYVDLCANRIATLEAVMEALTPHRAHVQELRLATPSASSSNAAAAAAAAAGAPPSTHVDDETASTTANTSSMHDSLSTFWLIEENPCCGMDGGRAAHRRPAFPAPSPRISTDDVERRLLDFFPRLLVVNGRSYGVDPLRTLRQQRLQQECAGADTAAVAAAETSHGEASSKDASNEEGRMATVAGSPSAALPADVVDAADAMLDDDDDAFAQLLRRPLPRLPSPTPSTLTSHSTELLSSVSSTSSATRAAARRRTSRSQSHRRRRRHHPAAGVVSPSPVRTSSSARLRGRAAAAQEGDTDDDAATSVSPLSATSTVHSPPSPPASTADAAAAAAAHTLRRRHSSAKQPRRAPLRRRRSAASASSVATALTTSPPSDTSPSPRAAAPSAPATPHARQFRFTAHSTEKRGASASQAARARTSTSLSPAGVTDTSDASPGAPAAAAAAAAAAAVPRAREPLRVVALDAPRRYIDAAEAESDADGSDARDDAVHRGEHDAGRVHPSPPPPPLVVSSTAGRMQWRPKLISRGTCTEGEWGNAVAFPAAAAAVSPREEELSAKVEQLQEQVALRTTTIGDLRRHLDLTRTQYVEGQREAQHRQQQLRSQVAALKDELARRGEEAAILERKQQAQLNRSVESVKAEWARRLEAAEQHEAAALEEANAAWAARLARSEETGVQLHQTLSVKSAQLATLERQTAVMESEMRAMRARATAQLRDAAARTALLLAESDARRVTQAAAAAAFADVTSSFHRTRTAQHAREAQDAVAGQTQAQAALRAQQAAWAVQEAEYEEALRHAAAQVQQATAAVASVSAATSVLLPSSLEAAAPTSQAGAALEAPADAAPLLPREEGDAALVLTPTAAALRAPVASSDGEEHHDTVHDERGHAAMALVPVSDHECSDSVTDYWRGACARVEEQLRCVEAALAVSTATQQSMAAENTRLLTRVAALESDAATAAAAHRSASAAAAQEKENLLRTLHTLRADMERKDAALDALEEEAHSKLNDKRRRIAELEEAVASLTEQQSRATETSAATREQLEASQAAVQRLQAELTAATERCTAMTQQQTVQLPDLERRHRELSELLATRNAEAHQHALEKSTLVHTLTVAREQLVRLHTSHQQLERTTASAAEQVTRLQAELEASRRQLREAQEAMRAKQKATFEMLSRMMVQDTL